MLLNYLPLCFFSGVVNVRCRGVFKRSAIRLVYTKWTLCAASKEGSIMNAGQ